MVEFKISYIQDIILQIYPFARSNLPQVWAITKLSSPSYTQAWAWISLSTRFL